MNKNMENEPKSKNKKLSMEDYLECFDHRFFEVLTYSQLNQILAIHGFRQYKIETKKEVLNAVRSIDLMDLRRTTIENEDVSPAFLTPEEVIRDLKDLKWDECHVSSLVTQRAPDSASSKTSNEKAIVGPVKRRKVTRKAKLKSIAAVSSVASTCTGLEMVLAKGKRSKRVKREMDVAKFGSDECSAVVSDGAIVVAGGTTDIRTSFFF